MMASPAVKLLRPRGNAADQPWDGRPIEHVGTFDPSRAADRACILTPMDSSTVLEPTVVEVDDAARLFAALADPARLRVLAVLADAQRCVCDIQSAAPMAANLLSYHLRNLREAGLVEGSRRGRFVDYRLTDGAAALIGRALGAAGFAAVVDQPAGCVPECEVAAR